MKRIRKFTAQGKNMKINITMEVVSGSGWDRPSFIDHVDVLADKIIMCIASFGIRFTKIKQK